jgi:hypothetical protein
VTSATARDDGRPMAMASRTALRLAVRALDEAVSMTASSSSEVKVS